MTAQTNYNPFNITDSLLSFVVSELDFKYPYHNGYCVYKRSQWLKKKGVYVIRDRLTKKILYVGRTSHCLYQQSYRHFTEHRKNSTVKGKYKDTYFFRGEVEIALFEYSNDCQMLEIMLTNYFKPKYNRNLFTESRSNPQVHCLRNKQEEMYTADYDLIEWFDLQNEAA